MLEYTDASTGSFAQQDEYLADPNYVLADPGESKIGRWATVALVLGWLLIMRQLMWRLHVPIPQRLLSAIIANLALIPLAMACLAARRYPIPSSYGHNGRLLILFVGVLWLASYGFIRGNFASDVVKDAVGCLMLTMLLFLGRYDAAWKGIRKPLIVLFYLTFVLVLATYRMPGIRTTGAGSEELSIKWIPRNMNTLGYSMRPMVIVALMIGAMGMVRRRTDFWRLLELGALPAYFVVDVLLFNFRGAAASLLGLVFVFIFLLPIARRRLQIGSLIAVMVLGAISLGSASRTQAFATLLRRFSHGGLFGERLEEAHRFISQMGIDLVMGRGMGGWYSGPNWATGLAVNGVIHWQTTHFGFLGFVLRGGVLLLVLAATFAVPAIFPKPQGWYRNEFNLVAFVLAPVLLGLILINPIDFAPDGFFVFLMWGFCFARFATPVFEVHH